MPEQEQQQQQQEQQQPVQLTEEQLGKLAQDSGAAAGQAVADALAAGVGDSQADVTFPDSMTVTLTDEQWTALMDARQADSEYFRQQAQLGSSVGVLTLVLVAACLGALLSQMLFSRWSS